MYIKNVDRTADIYDFQYYVAAIFDLCVEKKKVLTNI